MRQISIKAHVIMDYSELKKLLYLYLFGSSNTKTQGYLDVTNRGKSKSGSVV